MMRRSAWSGVLLLSLVLSSCSKQGSAPGSPGGESGSGSPARGGASGSADGGSASGKAAQNPDSVKIPPQDQQRAGIRIAPVEMRSVPRVLTVAGQVQMDEQHTSRVGAIADGRIEAVNVLPGEAVARGAVLATLHSHAVHETVAALAQAFAAVDRQRGAVSFAEQGRERYHHLFSIQAASLEESKRSEQDLLQANNQLLDAEANVRMEREHLSELLQVPPESLTRENLYSKELIPVRAAINGVVIAQNVTVGQVVSTGFEAFVISNLATVWVTGSVNEMDLPQVHAGTSADVITQGYPDRVFRGRVAMLGDTLDPQTRTVPVRIVVPNPETRLRPGMFATARIAEPKTQAAVFVPENALQDINGMRVVFLTRDGSNFRAQAVKLGTRSEGKAEVVEGLKPGDQVVVDGAFMVKSEMLKGTMGEE